MYFFKSSPRNSDEHPGLETIALDVAEQVRGTRKFTFVLGVYDLTEQPKYYVKERTSRLEKYSLMEKTICAMDHIINFDSSA